MYELVLIKSTPIERILHMPMRLPCCRTFHKLNDVAVSMFRSVLHIDALAPRAMFSSQYDSRFALCFGFSFRVLIGVELELKFGLDLGLWIRFGISLGLVRGRVSFRVTDICWHEFPL